MTRDELIKKINEELKDKLIKRGYSFEIEWQIKDTLKGYFDETDFKYISVEKRVNENLLFIRYKKHYLFGLRYAKTKGEHHYRTFEDYTDYYYKEFTCADQSEDFDLKKKMYEIEIKIIDEDEAKDKQFKEMTENYKKVKALFGDKTYSVLDYFSKHRYELERAL